jgi:hypothetical protein
MRIQFYETTILETKPSYDSVVPEAPLQFHMLASPAGILGDRGEMDYAPLLEGADVSWKVSSLPDIVEVLQLLLNEEIDWADEALLSLTYAPISLVQERSREQLKRQQRPSLPSKAYAFAEYVAAAPLIPMESSPLIKRSLAELFVGGGAVTLVVASGLPFLAAVGVAGLVVVTRALWRGAEPEVALFGEDLAHDLLNHLRARIGIPIQRERGAAQKDFVAPESVTGRATGEAAETSGNVIGELREAEQEDEQEQQDYRSES